ncbi:MAG: hypothetical protein ACR2Q4_24275 [Geminicoccaceae bacterium]
MEHFDQWARIVPNMADGLAHGISQFGDYAPLLWCVPLLWIIAGSLIWMHTFQAEQRQNRIYLTYASRNLPAFRRLAKQRSEEVLRHQGRDDALD